MAQMISLKVVPKVSPVDSGIVVAPPPPFDPPVVENIIKEVVDIPPPKEKFKPPSLTAIETALNLDLSGMAGSGVVVDTGIVGDELAEFIHQIKDLTVPPEAIQQVPPIYPIEYLRMGIEGSVTVEFVVRSDGTTTLVRAVNSTDRGFEGPSVKAVKKWLFRPGEKDGKAVSVWVRITIPFRSE